MGGPKILVNTSAQNVLVLDMSYFTYHFFVNTSGAYQILVTFDQLMTPVQGEGVLKFLAVSLHYVVYFDFLTQSLSKYPDDWRISQYSNVEFQFHFPISLL